MTTRLPWLALLLVHLVGLPAAAQAEAYKCKQPDGSLSFQDHPCAAGAVSSSMNLPPPTASPAVPADTAATRSGMPKIPASSAEDPARRRERAEIEERNRQTEAYNKRIRCERAKQQLEVVKEGRAYSIDNQGERHYVDEQNYKALIATKQRVVNQDCQ